MRQILSILILMMVASRAHSEATKDSVSSFWYLSPSGSDANDGRTQATAKRSPQVVADLAMPGDTIYFLDGVFENLTRSTVLTIKRSGQPGKPISFRAFPGTHPVLHNRQGWDVIKLVGVSHIEVSGLTLKGHADIISFDEAEREKNNLQNRRTSDNCLMITRDPKTRTPSSHIEIKNNTILDCGGAGLVASYSDYLNFEGNVVSRCAFWSPYGNSGISIYQPTSIDDSLGIKIRIRNNVVFGIDNKVPFFFSKPNNPEERTPSDGNGIIIDDNLNTQTRAGPAQHAYVGRTLVSNNVVFGNGGSGIRVFKSRNVSVLYNYVANNNLRFQQGMGEISAIKATDLKILNNVIVSAQVPYSVFSDVPAQIEFSHNILEGTLFGKSKDLLKVTGNKQVLTGIRLTDWTNGARKFDVDPKSPAIANAQPSKEEVLDFFGNLRSLKNPDAGAFNLTARQRK